MGQDSQDDTGTEVSGTGQPGLVDERMVEEGIQQQRLEHKLMLRFCVGIMHTNLY